jgi:hypothetical protein
MTGTNCKNHWSQRLLPPSFALSTSCQNSSQITAPIHSSSVNSPSNLPHPHTLFIYLSILLQLHPSLSTCTFIFCTFYHFQCVIAILQFLLHNGLFNRLTTLILPHLHMLYIDFFYCIIDCMLVYSMCNCVVCVELLCFILARSQLQMRTCSQLAFKKQ